MRPSPTARSGRRSARQCGHFVTGERLGHDIQRFAYLIDDDTNSELAFVLTDILDDIKALRADGKRVLVHCYAGQSRTGLVLRAWLMRTEGVSADEATQRVQEL